MIIGGWNPACMIQLASMPRSRPASRHVTTNSPLGMRPSIMATVSTGAGWESCVSVSVIGLSWDMEVVCWRGEGWVGTCLRKLTSSSAAGSNRGSRFRVVRLRAGGSPLHADQSVVPALESPRVWLRSPSSATSTA